MAFHSQYGVMNDELGLGKPGLKPMLGQGTSWWVNGVEVVKLLLKHFTRLENLLGYL